MNTSAPTNPEHIPGTMKGEEMLLRHGPEPGRKRGQRAHRIARDSTGIMAKSREPIDPKMPHLPPA